MASRSLVQQWNTLTRQSTELLRPLVPGSHLFGAVCCYGALENVDFWRDDIPVYFRIQRLFARQSIHVLRQFTNLWYCLHVPREGVLGYALLGQGC